MVHHLCHISSLFTVIHQSRPKSATPILPSQRFTLLTKNLFWQQFLHIQPFFLWLHHYTPVPQVWNCDPTPPLVLRCHTCQPRCRLGVASRLWLFEGFSNSFNCLMNCPFSYNCLWMFFPHNLQFLKSILLSSLCIASIIWILNCS